MRLPRDRGNKMKVDVNFTEQNGLRRVRLTLGEDDYRGKKNTDLTPQEVDDLVTLLQYWKGVVTGDIPHPNG